MLLKGGDVVEMKKRILGMITVGVLAAGMLMGTNGFAMTNTIPVQGNVIQKPPISIPIPICEPVRQKITITKTFNEGETIPETIQYMGTTLYKDGAPQVVERVVAQQQFSIVKVFDSREQILPFITITYNGEQVVLKAVGSPIEFYSYVKNAQGQITIVKKYMQRYEGVYVKKIKQYIQAYSGYIEYQRCIYHIMQQLQ